MNLLVDIGNSRIKWLLHDSDNNQFYAAGATLYNKVDLQILFDEHWGDLKIPSKVLVANVAGLPIEENLNAWVTKIWQLKTEYAQTGISSHGVHNAYSDPSELGVDRWMSMIAAWHKFQSHKKAICIIDCGTATTMDGISKTGQHIGGVIFPGYTLMQKALIQNTSGINVTTTRKTIPSDTFYNTTKQGINSGCALATIATIDKLAELMKEHYGEQTIHLITGGNAQFFIDQLRDKFEYEPDLVLHGLAIFANLSQ